MKSKNRPSGSRHYVAMTFIVSFFVFQNLVCLAETTAPFTKTTYPEIPYYLKQLQETDQEGKRMECNKIIHEAVINADLSDPRVVKKMEPMIHKIQMAADSGLDRPYLEGQSMWLMTAIEYFEREKLRTIVNIPQTDWMPDQTQSLNGLRLTTYPDKILFHDGKNTVSIVESANIYEAIISPDGGYVAFSRRTDEESRAEIWVADVKKRKRKKVAEIPSCRTLLFSMDGSRIFMQEEPTPNKADVPLYSISRGGGKAQIIGKIRMLETLVAKGPYKGNLIVYKTVIHHLGTTAQECAYAIRGNGKELGKLKDGPCR